MHRALSATSGSITIVIITVVVCLLQYFCSHTLHTHITRTYPAQIHSLSKRIWYTRTTEYPSWLQNRPSATIGIMLTFSQQQTVWGRQQCKVNKHVKLIQSPLCCTPAVCGYWWNWTTCNQYRSCYLGSGVSKQRSGGVLQLMANNRLQATSVYSVQREKCKSGSDIGLLQTLNCKCVSLSTSHGNRVASRWWKICSTIEKRSR